jgi:DNA ligase-associated metallophosphoesterase
MQMPVLHILQQQQLWLTTQRAIYWQQQNALILSDLHLGKTGHFRKHGIAIPQQVYKEDLQRLASLMAHFKPALLIIVGDLFHSHANKELDLFVKWRNDFSHVHIQLVKGNHDILKADWYLHAGIETVEHEWQLGPFRFMHNMPADCGAADKPYCFSGHLHPGIKLNGLAKQSLAFPCYYFGSHHAVLPAFSRFTGLATIKPQKGDQLFALVEDAVVPLSK